MKMTGDLFTTCEQLLLHAAGTANLGGDVYRRISFRGRPYHRFDLLWDGPDQILIIAFCRTDEELRQTQDDLLLFHTALPLSGVYKKLHLVIIHDPTVKAEPLPWPAGLSYTPIAHPLTGDQPAGPVQGVADKLGSLFDWRTDEVASALKGRQNRRTFLQVDDVVKLIREGAAERGKLPKELRAYAKELLAMAEAPGDELEERVSRLLDRLWEEGF